MQYKKNFRNKRILDFEQTETEKMIQTYKNKKGLKITNKHWQCLDSLSMKKNKSPFFKSKELFTLLNEIPNLSGQYWFASEILNALKENKRYLLDKSMLFELTEEFIYASLFVPKHFYNITVFSTFFKDRWVISKQAIDELAKIAPNVPKKFKMSILNSKKITKKFKIIKQKKVRIGLKNQKKKYIKAKLNTWVNVQKPCFINLYRRKRGSLVKFLDSKMRGWKWAAFKDYISDWKGRRRFPKHAPFLRYYKNSWFKKEDFGKCPYKRGLKRLEWYKKRSKQRYFRNYLQNKYRALPFKFTNVFPKYRSVYLVIQQRSSNFFMFVTNLQGEILYKTTAGEWSITNKKREKIDFNWPFTLYKREISKFLKNKRFQNIYIVFDQPKLNFGMSRLIRKIRWSRRYIPEIQWRLRLPHSDGLRKKLPRRL